MLTLSSHTRIFVYSGPTDMRKGFNGLGGLVAEHFDVELLSGHLFLFCNRSRDRIKLTLKSNNSIDTSTVSAVNDTAKTIHN